MSIFLSASLYDAPGQMIDNRDLKIKFPIIEKYSSY